MPLAVKNGSIILKDGKLAENCNCCAAGGGWYCCEDKIGQCRDRLGDVLKLTATISAQDYTKHSLVTGCGCSEAVGGGSTWISRYYLWPGSKYVGTFPLTARRNPPSVGIVEVGKWWAYEYFFPADEAGCVGAYISVDVNVRVPGDPFQITQTTRLQINPLTLNGREYSYSRSSKGTPSPETKSLSSMKCVFTQYGPATGCLGLQEIYSTGLIAISAGSNSVFTGACSIVTPNEIVRSGSISAPGPLSCGDEKNPGTPTDLGETGSLAYALSLKIEQA